MIEHIEMHRGPTNVLDLVLSMKWKERNMNSRKW